MVFVTAFFGPLYAQVGKGLLRSLRAFSPKVDIHIFTDQKGIAGAEYRKFLDLWRANGRFYIFGQRKNVLKFNLIEEMQQKCPGQTVCWIDADTLILDNVLHHFRDGKLNVITRGSEGTGMRMTGNGLMVPGNKYVIGGMYAIPPGKCLPEIRRIMKDRLSWKDSPDDYSGDMVIMNHLVHASKFPARFVTDDKRFIYNFEVSGGDPPTIGNKRLGEIRIEKNSFMLRKRKIAVFCWTMGLWMQHRENGFSTFSRQVAKRFKEFYAP